MTNNLNYNEQKPQAMLCLIVDNVFCYYITEVYIKDYQTKTLMLVQKRFRSYCSFNDKDSEKRNKIKLPAFHHSLIVLTVKRNAKKTLLPYQTNLLKFLSTTLPQKIVCKSDFFNSLHSEWVNYSPQEHFV